MEWLYKHFVTTNQFYKISILMVKLCYMVLFKGNLVLEQTKTLSTLMPLLCEICLFLFIQWFIACLEPCHFLNQCWRAFIGTVWNKRQWNFDQNEKGLENIICKMLNILFRLEGLYSHKNNRLVGAIRCFVPERYRSDFDIPWIARHTKYGKS